MILEDEEYTTVAAMEPSRMAPPKIKKKIGTYDPELSFWGIYPQELKAGS